jgi:hypothetical protein
MLVKLSINQISGYLFEIAITNIIESKPKQDQFKINQMLKHETREKPKMIQFKKEKNWKVEFKNKITK